jgi:hypothetical protein
MGHSCSANMRFALGPLARRVINVRDLIQSSIPDSEGKTLPAELTSGTYRIKEVNRAGYGSLF